MMIDPFSEVDEFDLELYRNEVKPLEHFEIVLGKDRLKPPKPISTGSLETLLLTIAKERGKKEQIKTLKVQGRRRPIRESRTAGKRPSEALAANRMFSEKKSPHPL